LPKATRELAVHVGRESAGNTVWRQVVGGGTWC